MRSNNSQNQPNQVENNIQYRQNLNDSAHSPKATKQLPFRQLQQHLQQQLQQHQQQKSSPPQQHHHRAKASRSDDVPNNRGGMTKHSQQRKPSHFEKPAINDLINVPQAPSEGELPLDWVLYRSSMRVCPPLNCCRLIYLSFLYFRRRVFENGPSKEVYRDVLL